ncbi:hypothetical protein [Corallococcus sicarius]|uniref:hypothetical protein n=1 Tax=Corallococcus sicarius TaxID=2316726 RepID=UPI001FCA2EA9|nr:hypothetical protein [Corallococcus sicarius]
MNAEAVGRRFTALALCVLLAACGATRATVAPAPEELPRRVLLLRESPDGSFTPEWRPAGEVDLARYVKAEEGPRIVRTARSVRDCDAEHLECMQECLSRSLPRDYKHFESPRGKGGKEDYCNRRCLQPYLDCADLEKLRPQELSSVEEVSDWASRHRESLLIGGVIIIAGVTFVIVSAGAGLVVLAPAVLLTTSAGEPARSLAEARP